MTSQTSSRSADTVEKEVTTDPNALLDRFKKILAAEVFAIVPRIEALERQVTMLTMVSDAQQVLTLTSGVHRDIVVELFHRMGLREVEGLPVCEWWERAAKQHFETVLIRLEDENPEAAAFLQSVIDGTLPPVSL